MRCGAADKVAGLLALALAAFGVDRGGGWVEVEPSAVTVLFV